MDKLATYNLVISHFTLHGSRSPTTRRSIYTSSSRFGAPRCGAASTARACSSVAVKCKAACLSVYTYKLTSYMSFCLWAVLQENYREEYGLAVNSESIPSRAKVETITHSLSARHSHARWALGGERIRAFLFIVSAECALPTNASLFDFFARILANAPHPHESLRTCFVCATHAHSHFCPQHWLLCHLGLY